MSREITEYHLFLFGIPILLGLLLILKFRFRWDFRRLLAVTVIFCSFGLLIYAWILPFRLTPDRDPAALPHQRDLVPFKYLIKYMRVLRTDTPGSDHYRSVLVEINEITRLFVLTGVASFFSGLGMSILLKYQLLKSAFLSFLLILVPTIAGIYYYYWSWSVSKLDGGVLVIDAIMILIGCLVAGWLRSSRSKRSLSASS